ncbi:MAG: bifunctional [glutamate--ammonia ligase]-adenylyl-L-tyrosine phosphorylase/[glutamate--ammonia-ligase] adenylyltransferase [Deltaproteobacteria bacterium]|nr:bifunctional [glutamate--ammonia ligase]-adenylyl-L-tyrosine phosphorylase/[glutamate--ammonia-ligase] adenylyltransferase [Deltaproteobacteria bacterium]
MIADILSKVELEASSELGALGFSDPKCALRNLKALEKTGIRASLDAVLESVLESASPDAALNNLERVASESAETLQRLPQKDLSSLIKVCGSSNFLTSIILKNPQYLGWLFNEGLNSARSIESLSEEITARTQELTTIEEVSKELRLIKQREYLRIGSRDLLRLSTLEETTRELSDLASASLDAAVNFSIERLKAAHGSPLYIDHDGAEKEAGLTVIGMGKLGGRELNFSSDIDIIYIYSSDKGETTGVEGKDGSAIALHAFFVKASTMATKLISNVTEDGFVFRVDLDLRPEGRSGDAANSLRSAEVYYESWGQMWERAAMIKARPVAGSRSLGEEFLSMIRPFVFRKYLDFTAIEEIKSMKEKIDLSLLRRNPDAIDVKLGAGGIREIEFFCQALQLIHAGKDTLIRERNTLKTLRALLTRKYIKEEEESSLRQAYIFLRDLEHRIQIVEGRQSQAIPPSPEALEKLARMMGFSDTDEKKAGEFFWEEYRRTTHTVHEIFRSLFYASEETIDAPAHIRVLLSPDLPPVDGQEMLSELGFKDAETAWKNITHLREGPSFVHLSAKARVILQKLGPRFLERASRSPDPDRALAHLDRFISSIGARTTFYSLLLENPGVMDELIKVMGTSVFLSRDLIEHPESLDILLSNELSIPCKRKEDILSAFLLEASSGKDYETKLDTIRRLKSQELFRIGMNDIAGALTLRQVSNQMTFIAEAALEAAITLAKDELSERYGECPTGSFSVIGLGKLGGRELIYGSDLDILFVYSDSPDGHTTGPKEISSHEYFVKLGQRIISVLTLRTKEGFVFNVDARLRPSGSAGVLVVSEEALLKYHSGATQVWERQALTKARAVAGDITFGKNIVKKLWDELYARELGPADIDEMLRIRGRMEVEIAKEDSTRYNIKTGEGGIVDCEFLVQALQLRWGGSKKGLQTPYTLKALSRLGREGLLTIEERSAVQKAYSFMRSIETRQRIVHDRPEGYLYRASEELHALARRLGYTGSDAGEKLLKAYAEHAERVRKIYLKTLTDLKGGLSATNP